MPDNLSISISADSAKARADFELLGRKARELRKELKGLADDVQKGAGVTPAMTAKSGELLAVERQMQSYRTAARSTVAANVVVSRSFSELAKQVGEFGHAVGLPIEGLRSLRLGLIAFGAVQVIRGITAAVDKITALVRAGKETGAATAAIQELGLAVEKTGGQADDANKIFAKSRELFDRSRQQALEAGELLGPVQVARGGTRDQFSDVTNIGNSAVQVLRGGQKAIVDFSKSLKELQIDIRKFPPTEAGFLDYTQTVMRRVLALKNAGQIDRADKLSIDALGASLRVIGPSLELFIRDREALRQELIRSGQLVSEEDKQRAREYTDALNKLSNAFNGLVKQIVVLAGPELTRFFNDLTKGISDSIQQVKTLIGWVQKFIDIGKSVDAVIAKTFTPGASSSALPQFGDPSIPAMPTNAAGGYIRGPGSGTSDSILARLSNGEFVLNAGSVRRLGVDFLQGLNNFAAGGLVGAPPIRFAAGGLASASSGRAVHLHLGSQSFALSGSAGVVDALVSEAHWQQTRSAGVKPSWFAGRPSGR